VLFIALIFLSFYFTVRLDAYLRSFDLLFVRILQ
jgi:hypothetical protein